MRSTEKVYAMKILNKWEMLKRAEVGNGVIPENVNPLPYGKNFGPNRFNPLPNNKFLDMTN